MSGNARIGSTVIVSPSSKSDSRVLHVRLGRPLTSALHEPHLAALQFQRTARSGASWAWIQWSASRTTIPSSTGTSNSSNVPSARGRAAEDPEVGVRPSGALLRPSASAAELVGHRGQLRRRDLHRRRRRGGRRCSSLPHFSAWSPGSRAGCGRRGSPRAAGAAGDGLGRRSSRLRSSKTRFQPGLKARPPDDADVRPARSRISSSSSIAVVEVRLRSGRSRRATASPPGAPRWSAVRIRRRRRRAERRRRARPPPPGPAVGSTCGSSSRPRRVRRRAGARPAGRTRAGPTASCRRAGSRRASRRRPRPRRTAPSRVVAPVSASTRMPPIT